MVEYIITKPLSTVLGLHLFLSLSDLKNISLLIKNMNNEINELNTRLIYLKQLCDAIIKLKSEDLDISITYDKTYTEYMYVKNKLRALTFLSNT